MMSFVRNNKSLLYSVQGLKCIFAGRSAKGHIPDHYPEKEHILKIERGTKRELEAIPSIVWLYWEDKNIPHYIQQIVKHNQSINPGYSFRFLNKESYRTFLPDIVFETEMPIANKTDIIRLALLSRYGGIWMDATVILRDSLDWVQQVDTSGKYELIGFYRDNDTNDYNFPVVETYFMAAPKDSSFVGHWLAMFEDIITLGSKGFYKKMQDRADYNEILQKIPNPSYLLVYLAGQAACRENPAYDIYLKRAEDSALFLQECYRDNYKMNYAICRMANPLSNLGIIKLCSGDRMFVPFYQKFNMVKKNSLIGFFDKGGED